MTERFRVSGIEIEWETEGGVQRWDGVRTICTWLETTIAGLMSGMQRMVGTERFNLCLQSGGRDGTSDDWTFISSHPTFEDGFAALADLAAASGWGRWKLVSLDREKKEARFRIVNSWEAYYQRAIGVAWGSSYVGGKLSGICSKLFGVDCWATQTSHIAKGDPYDELVIRPSELTLEQELTRLLESDHATRADLAVALEQLRREVEERREAERGLREVERGLREKLDIIKQQEEAIQALSTPILQVWEGVLALPIIGILDSARAASVMERLLAEIVRSQCRYAILDLTGVEHVDASTADHILRIVQAVELLGARALITGIRPAVAQAMTELGVDLSRLVTLSHLQKALEHCIRQGVAVEREGGPAPRR